MVLMGARITCTHRLYLPMHVHTGYPCGQTRVFSAIICSVVSENVVMIFESTKKKLMNFRALICITDQGMLGMSGCSFHCDLNDVLSRLSGEGKAQTWKFIIHKCTFIGGA